MEKNSYNVEVRVKLEKGLDKIFLLSVEKVEKVNLFDALFTNPFVVSTVLPLQTFPRKG